ncbi:Hpt domain-containing protein [Alsobacter sp. R-9]
MYDFADRRPELDGPDGQARRSLPVLDRGHLAAQTMHDADVARDVLAMFLEQSAQVMRRLRESRNSDERIQVAHLLKGSARAVGATRVAAAAAAVEDLPPGTDETQALPLIVALHASVAEARAAIAAELDGNTSLGL